jgi:2-oxoglutarate ferredoxin oxidoreductase subunit delta
MPKGRVVIDIDRCKGCALCITACAQGVLIMAEDRLNARGYHPAQLVDPNGDCTGCGLCAIICPDTCFTVYRTVSHKAAKPALN